MDKVVGLCGRTFGDEPERYQLSDNDGNEITAPEWHRFITNQTGFSATVRISLYSTSPPEALDHPGSDRSGLFEGDGDNHRNALVQLPHEKDPADRQARIPRQDRRKRLDEKRKAKLEREIADVIQFDLPNPPKETSDDTAAHHEGPADISLVLKDHTRRYMVDSPSELTESSADEHTDVHLYRQPRPKRPPARRDTRDTAQPSYPIPIRTSTYRSGQHQSRNGHSRALVPYRGADDTARQLSTPSRKTTGHARERDRVSERRSSYDRSPNRHNRALIRKDEVPRMVVRETSLKRRREGPTYKINYIPNTITNTFHDSGTFDYIFYVPKDIFESLQAPIGDDQRFPDPVESTGTANEGSGGTEAPGLSSDPKIQVQGGEGRSKTSKPAWKADQNEENQQDPPPPVFLWPTGSAKQQRHNPATSGDKAGRNQQSNPDNTECHETPGNDLSDLRVLNFILAQIHSNLTQGNRVSLDTVGMLSEKEAPIYRGLLEASKDAVMERLASFSGASSPKKPQGEIIPRVRLCFDVLVELLEFFLPQDYPFVVVKKFWYAVDIWIRGLEQLMSAKDAPPKNIKHRPDSARPLDAYYVVNARYAPRGSQEPELKFPELEIKDCNTCLQRVAHPLLEDGVLHLRQKHFPHAEVSDKDLQEWIRRGDQVDAFQLQCDAKRLVDTILDHCNSLRAMKKEIVAGVCRDGKFESTIYRLPNGLVKAFERIVMMMAYSGYVVSFAYKTYQKSPGGFHPFVEFDRIKHIIDLGYGAESAFEEAKSNLMMMSRVNEYSSSIQYDTVGPEYLLILLLADLKDRTTRRHKLNLIAIYQKQLDQLVRAPPLCLDSQYLMSLFDSVLDL